VLPSILSRSLKEKEGNVNRNGKKNKQKEKDKKLKLIEFGKRTRDSGLRQNADTPKSWLLNRKGRGLLLKLRREEGSSDKLLCRLLSKKRLHVLKKNTDLLKRRGYVRRQKLQLSSLG